MPRRRAAFLALLLLAGCGSPDEPGTSGGPAASDSSAQVTEAASQDTFTRGDDGRFTVTSAEAVPLVVELGADAVRVLPADPETFDRVSGVLGSRGGVDDGLRIVLG